MYETRPTVLPPDRGMRKELQDLYARRSAIDDLIQSLEEYDRFCVPQMQARSGSAPALFPQDCLNPHR